MSFLSKKFRLGVAGVCAAASATTLIAIDAAVISAADAQTRSNNNKVMPTGSYVIKGADGQCYVPRYVFTKIGTQRILAGPVPCPPELS